MGVVVAADDCSDLNNIASPDNIAVIRGTDTLIIYKDTSLHNNNMLWSMDVNVGVSKCPQYSRLAPLQHCPCCILALHVVNVAEGS